MPKGTSLASLHFKRPIVWITGASRGIGREIAKQFASIGCMVALSARSKSELLSLEKEITSRGGQASNYPCDLTNMRAAFSTAEKIIQAHGGVDVLVNNAGDTVFKSLHATSVQDFTRIFSVNLMGAVLAIKAVYPLMMKRKSGWIVNILSTAALKTFTESSAYSATKAGLQVLGNVLREEARPYNIKVTNVYPGPTNTKMWTPAERKKYRSRMMNPKSVAEAVLAIYQMPPDVVVEEIVLRPIQGDID